MTGLAKNSGDIVRGRNERPRVEVHVATRSLTIPSTRLCIFSVKHNQKPGTISGLKLSDDSEILKTRNLGDG